MEQQPYFQTGSVQRPNTFAFLSAVLGAFALLSCTNIYTTVFCASTSLLFAMLSRQDSLNLSVPAKIGFVISPVAIILGAFIFLFMAQLFGLEVALDPIALEEKIMNLWMSLLETSGGVK